MGRHAHFLIFGCLMVLWATHLSPPTGFGKLCPWISEVFLGLGSSKKHEDGFLDFQIFTETIITGFSEIKHEEPNMKSAQHRTWMRHLDGKIWCHLCFLRFVRCGIPLRVTFSGNYSPIVRFIISGWNWNQNSYIS